MMGREGSPDPVILPSQPMMTFPEIPTYTCLLLPSGWFVGTTWVVLFLPGTTGEWMGGSDPYLEEAVPGGGECNCKEDTVCLCHTGLFYHYTMPATVTTKPFYSIPPYVLLPQGGDTWRKVVGGDSACVTPPTCYLPFHLPASCLYLPAIQFCCIDSVCASYQEKVVDWKEGTLFGLLCLCQPTTTFLPASACYLPGEAACLLPMVPPYLLPTEDTIFCGTQNWET